MTRGSITMVLVAVSSTASAQPGLTLPAGGIQATVNLEADTSAHAFADTVSIAPDVSVGISDDLTLSVIHSTVGRTGFRGGAGGGFCVTDRGCPKLYDNAGVEGLYSLVRGGAALAIDAGAYATSFDRDDYVAKVGAKVRFILDRVTLATLPSVTIAVTERDAMVPNRDRLWLPVSAMIAVVGGLAIGASTGLKAPLDGTFSHSYEIALGAVATYAYSPALLVGASWIHGKLIAGDAARPAGVDGIDGRAFQLWITATY